MKEKTKKIISKILEGLIYLLLTWSIIGIITFVLVSCLLTWVITFYTIQNTIPDYDLTNLLFLFNIIVKLLTFQVGVIIGYIIYISFNKKNDNNKK